MPPLVPRALIALAMVGGMLVACGPGQGSALPGLLRDDRSISDLVLAPAAELDAPVLAGSTNFHTFVHAAFDGTQYFVTWTDSRVSGSSVFGARLGTDGMVRDSTGIRIADYGLFPTAGSGGGSYLAVWTGVGSVTPGLFAARVTSSGTLLDTTPIQITPSPLTGTSSVSFGGGVFLVTWVQAVSGSQDIWGARVATDGTVLDPAGFLISNASGEQTLVVSAFATDRFLVVWQDTRAGAPHVYGSRVLTDGTVLESPGTDLPIQTASQEQAPSVTSNGADFFVAWEEPGAQGQDTYGRRVTSSGALWDGTGLPLGVANNGQTEVATAFDGTQYWAAWADDRTVLNVQHIYATRISTSGVVTDPTGIQVSGTSASQQTPSFAGGAGAAAIYWIDNRQGNPEVFGSRLDGAGNVRDPLGIDVSTAAANETDPAGCFDGTTFLAVWSDARNTSSSSLLGVRVDRQGALLDSIPQTFASGPNLRTTPKLSCGDGVSLLVWNQLGPINSIQAVRIGPAGRVLDAAPLVLNPPGGFMSVSSVAALDNRFLVTWERADLLPNWEIVAVTVDGATGAVGPRVQLGTLSSSSEDPSVATNGSGWYVVWGDFAAGIKGTPVDSNGNPTHPGGQILSTNTNTLQAYVAWGVDHYQAIWIDFSVLPWHIGGIRLAPDGTPLAPGEVSALAPPQSMRPVGLVFDGTHFVVGLDTAYFTNNTDGYVARIDTQGQAVDTTPLLVEVGSPRALSPVPVTDGAGTDLIFYSSFDVRPGYQASRARMRLLQNVSQGVACTADNQCASGFCADGVCCDSACGGGAIDCLACSAATGSSQNGRCETARAGVACRSMGDACDVVELCDGAAITCPDDDRAAEHAVCSQDGSLGFCSSGVCETPEPYRVAFACDSTGRSIPGLWGAWVVIALGFRHRWVTKIRRC